MEEQFEVLDRIKSSYDKMSKNHKQNKKYNR